MPASAVIFDAYGTLFDVTSAARTAAAQSSHPDLAARHEDLSRIWREKQVGYSWWRAVTGDYRPFWDVTGDALDYALEATGLSGDPVLRVTLMDLYRTLSAYAEVPAMLDALRAHGRRTAILSNGSPEMLADAIASAGVADKLDAVLSVDEVRTFKPAAQVYDLVGATFQTDPREVLFVSSNGWDAAAASGYGFETVWVNRTRLPLDRLPHEPARVVADLTAIPTIAEQVAP